MITILSQASQAGRALTSVQPGKLDTETLSRNLIMTIIKEKAPHDNSRE